jgi:hypothetical protein
MMVSIGTGALVCECGHLHADLLGIFQPPPTKSTQISGVRYLSKSTGLP